jgi:hypothetical protein
MITCITVIAVPAPVLENGTRFGNSISTVTIMEPFEIIFDLTSGRRAATVERRESPQVQYVVYFKDEDLDLKYGQLIYEIKSGQLMNNDEKSLEGADLIAQIGLEIKNHLQDNKLPLE